MTTALKGGNLPLLTSQESDHVTDLCVDRLIPLGAQHSWKEGLFHHDFSSRDFELAMPLTKRWPNGTHLRCRFLGGSPQQQYRVESIAREWEQHANIRFQFGTETDAALRIAFNTDGRSWSAVGTDALNPVVFPREGPTMNFGWLREDTAEVEARRLVLHEFGHALGAIHEHQQPESALPWNEAAVLAAFSGPPNNWTRSEILRNVIGRYSRAQLNWSQFDPLSIMLYHFPASLFMDHAGTPLNSELSETDERFMRALYPR